MSVDEWQRFWNVDLPLLWLAHFLGNCITGLAEQVKETIEIQYKNIRIFVDGTEKLPPGEPFVYNNTTYVPLRFVSEALGKEVEWDGSNNSIYIGNKPSQNAVTQTNIPSTSITGSYQRFYSNELIGAEVKITEIGNNDIYLAERTYKRMHKFSHHINFESLGW